jgi:glycosyltransferase involved in cell wall biosynthesis
LTKARVLYVVHNHPSVAPGGAETYALNLYTAMRDTGAFEPLLLARTGPPHVARPTAHPGTVLAAANHDPRQYLFLTDVADFNWLLWTNRRKPMYLQDFRNVLHTYQPDVVHFQHTLFWGVDMLLATRQVLPDAPIVYTLHEYGPICHHNGQMVRTKSHELCLEASPRACHACFPEISTQDFFLRTRFLHSHLARVDQFLAPSRFLLERFVEWGIPRAKIAFEDYGQPTVIGMLERETTRVRDRIGFFGQLTPFKGLTVLLEAIKLLVASRSLNPVPHVWIHGSNLEFFPRDFQDTVNRLFRETQDYVTVTGRYDAAQLPRLMANVDWVVVPSIWWENSPLVIQEAFSCGRPVICSDIGGMAEKVANEVNGLHFRANDPFSLAETIARAVSSPGLWETLRRQISPPHSMRQHVATLEHIYRRLLDGERPS